MIRIMWVNPPGDNHLKILFKLTEPQEKLDDEMGEYVPDRAVKLGLGGNIFKALGYKWSGGSMAFGDKATDNHRFFYTNVEQDRFSGGPVYMEMLLAKTGERRRGWTIIGCKRYIPQLQTDEGVLALPMIEAVEAPE